MPELSPQERRMLRGPHYVVKGDSTRPEPVTPSKPPFPTPEPTEADRKNARRFLELKEDRA